MRCLDISRGSSALMCSGRASTPVESGQAGREVTLVRTGDASFAGGGPASAMLVQRIHTEVSPWIGLELPARTVGSD